MAITLRGTAENTGALTVVITLPGGTAENDVAYAAAGATNIIDQNCTGTWSGGGGAELADLYSNDSSDVNFGLYRKVQGATPDSTVTIDCGSTHAGVAIVLIGVDTATPEDTATTTATGIDSPDPDPPAITTVTANAWVLPFAGSSQSDTVTAPTNYVNLVDITNTAITAMGSTREIASGGTNENPGIYDVATGSGADSWCAATVCVRPAAGGGGSTVPVKMHDYRRRRAA